MRYELRGGWVGTTIEPMLATTAETVRIVVTGASGWAPTTPTATVTINDTTIPVHPEMLSIESPMPERLDPFGLLGVAVPQSEVADVVIRFRVLREGLQITYQREGT